MNKRAQEAGAQLDEGQKSADKGKIQQCLF